MTEPKKEPVQPQELDELREDELEQIAGGVRAEVTLNKAKTADKAFKAMDEYIRG